MADEGYRWIGLGKTSEGTITVREDGESRHKKCSQIHQEEKEC